MGPFHRRRSAIATPRRLPCSFPAVKQRDLLVSSPGQVQDHAPSSRACSRPLLPVLHESADIAPVSFFEDDYKEARSLLHNDSVSVWATACGTAG